MNSLVFFTKDITSYRSLGKERQRGYDEPPFDADNLILRSSLSDYGTVLETRSINALGDARRQWTDAAGRTLRSFDELDEATVFTYDASGNQLSVRDPNNVGEDVVYDALGRAGLRTDTNSDTTNSGYEDAGNRISATDGKSNTTSYSYDARGRQVKQTDRLSGETEFAYTATGQLASLTDAEDQTTSYAYDDAGNKLTETYPDHVTSSTVGQTSYGIISFTYDPAGRVDIRTDQQGDTCTYDYDLAGRLTSRDYRNVGVQALADSDSFTYDAASRMLTAVSGRYANTVTYTYDSAGRKATEALTISGQTYTTTISYNAAGQLTGYTYPDGTVVGRSYTDRGQLYQLTHASSTIDTRTYDDGGRMTGSSYGNGVSESRSYNTRKKNTLASISFSGATFRSIGYGWDDNKNKTSESITGTMSGYGFSVGSSGYDTEDRLVNWERSDTNLDQSWNLSLVGDWTSYIENSATQNRTHGPTHELLSAGGQSLSHDTKGNMTLIPAVLRDGTNSLTLNWDFENKLTTADVGSDTTIDVTYKWDALGRRVYRDDGTSPRVFVQVGQQTIADYGAGIAASTPKYRYVYASYIDEPVLRYEPSATETLYYHRNQQYSVIALTDGTGAIEERYSYSAYGEPVFTNASGTVLADSAKDNRYTFTGREWDEELNLYHFRARMYDAGSGRFCGRDPIRYKGGMNLSEFVGSQPENWVDPLGLDWTAGRNPPPGYGSSPPGNANGLPWMIPDFFGWYYYGFGQEVNIMEVGLFEPWLAQVNSQIHSHMNLNVLGTGFGGQVSCENPRGQFSGSTSVQTTTQGGFQVTTIMGTSQVNIDYECSYSVGCVSCCARNHVSWLQGTCTMKLSVRDRFANPLDWNGKTYERDEEAYQACMKNCRERFPWWNPLTAFHRQMCMEGCNAKYPPSEWPGATPYDLVASWEDSFSFIKDFGGCP